MSLFVHACMSPKGDAAQMQVRDARWSRVTTRVSCFNGAAGSHNELPKTTILNIHSEREQTPFANRWREIQRVSLFAKLTAKIEILEMSTSNCSLYTAAGKP